MFPSRRSFLGSAFALAAALAWGGKAQGQSGPNPSPASNDPFYHPFGSPRLKERDLLAANQENIRKDVVKLSDIVQQLQKQLEDNDMRDVFPLDVIRKTDEIQKLAKHINSLVRG